MTTLPLLPSRVAFTVTGTPVPQGSKVANHFGKGVRDANAAKLRPWRDHVQAVAADACRYIDTYTGPVKVRLWFSIERPKSHYRTGRNAHLLKPDAPSLPVNKRDVDKLQRAVFDSLTDAGVWTDDGLVVDVRARKFYAGEHELAPVQPGVTIMIEAAA